MYQICQTFANRWLAFGEHYAILINVKLFFENICRHFGKTIVNFAIVSSEKLRNFCRSKKRCKDVKCVFGSIHMYLLANVGFDAAANEYSEGMFLMCPDQDFGILYSTELQIPCVRALTCRPMLCDTSTKKKDLCALHFFPATAPDLSTLHSNVLQPLTNQTSRLQNTHHDYSEWDYYEGCRRTAKADVFAIVEVVPRETVQRASLVPNVAHEMAHP